MRSSKRSNSAREKNRNGKKAFVFLVLCIFIGWQYQIQKDVVSEYINALRPAETGGQEPAHAKNHNSKDTATDISSISEVRSEEEISGEDTSTATEEETLEDAAEEEISEEETLEKDTTEDETSDEDKTTEDATKEDETSEKETSEEDNKEENTTTEEETSEEETSEEDKTTEDATEEDKTTEEETSEEDNKEENTTTEEETSEEDKTTEDLPLTTEETSTTHDDTKETTTFPCVNGDEQGCATFPTLRSPKEELDDFLAKFPDSNGAHFVKLLKEYLHTDPTWERERLDACYRNRNFSKCFAGMKNYNAASEEERTSMQLKMPFYEDTEGAEGSVYQAHHFRDTDKSMSFLGTHTVCMPLLLATSTVTESGMVVELGPFAGLTSKCAAMGLRKASEPRENALVSYDTYEDTANFKAISSKSPWVKESYPDFTADNTDFFQIWKDTVQFEYPSAVGRKGYASKTTLNDEIIGDKNIEVLMIDSAKSGPALHEQAGGITIHAGSILFLMDVEKLRAQLLQVYGCLRSGFIVPVYASLGQEHWAWVVTKSFNVNQPWMKQCYANIAKDVPTAEAVLAKQSKADIEFVASGLTGDEKRANEQFEYWINRVYESYEDLFSTSNRDGYWGKMARIGQFDS